MALLQPSLAQLIRGAYDDSVSAATPAPGSPPNVPLAVAERLGRAYDSYARTVLAPVLTVVTPPNLPGLVAALTAPMLSGWAPGLVAYWTPVTFFGPGLIPVNPIDPSSLASLAPIVSTGVVQALAPPFPATTAEAAARMASALHSATLSLRVITTTTTVPPVVAPVPFG